MSRDGPAPTTPASAADVASPCTRRCCLDDEDVCLGCGRHLHEIIAWHDADAARRRAILAAAAVRLARRPGSAG